MPRFLPLPKSGFKRWLALIGYLVAGLILFVVMVGVSVVILWKTSPNFQGWIFEKMMGAQTSAEERRDGPGLTASYSGFAPRADAVQSAADIYRATNLWTFRFHFTAAEYDALGPNRIASSSMNGGDHAGPVLRNPNAPRNGLAGVLGFDFPSSTALVEIGERQFSNVAVRFKGNGTFLSGLGGYKKPLKLDLNKHEKTQDFGGRHTFNLGNLSADFTCLSDTLAYEFFRDAGVIAPRTAFARVFHTIDGRTQDRLLGLYVLVENPDRLWAKDSFQSEEIALFKPVTPSPFTDIGQSWSNYAGIYDPKTKPTPAQTQRVIDLAQLVSHSDDAEFVQRIAEMVDLEQAAKFFACEVLLANYDGILAQGQNYLTYHDPRSNRFGFIPWDLDHSWGEFPFIGKAEDREQSSIRKPWVGENPFLQRLWATPAFEKRYRAELQRLLDTLFTPDRLERRIDELAAVIRPAVAEMPKSRQEKFEHAVSGQISNELRDGKNPMDNSRPGWQLKRFIRARADHVRKQLAGEAEGITPLRMNF